MRETACGKAAVRAEGVRKCLKAVVNGTIAVTVTHRFVLAELLTVIMLWIRFNIKSSLNINAVFPVQFRGNGIFILSGRSTLNFRRGSNCNVCVTSDQSILRKD